MDSGILDFLKSEKNGVLANWPLFWTFLTVFSILAKMGFLTFKRHFFTVLAISLILAILAFFEKPCFKMTPLFAVFKHHPSSSYFTPKIMFLRGPKPWKWPIFDQIRSKPEIFSRCEGTLFLFSKWKNMSFTATKYFRFWPKLSKICHFLDPPRFFTFLDKSCDHFFGSQDVRKWHILVHFWTPFLTTSWQIPTQIGYPTGASRSWPSKRGLILTPLFGPSRYTPIRGIYPHFLDHFWTKNGQKTGPRH